MTPSLTRHAIPGVTLSPAAADAAARLLFLHAREHGNAELRFADVHAEATFAASTVGVTHADQAGAAVLVQARRSAPQSSWLPLQSIAQCARGFCGHGSSSPPAPPSGLPVVVEFDPPEPPVSVLVVAVDSLQARPIRPSSNHAPPHCGRCLRFIGSPKGSPLRHCLSNVGDKLSVLVPPLVGSVLVASKTFTDAASPWSDAGAPSLHHRYSSQNRAHAKTESAVVDDVQSARCGGGRVRATAELVMPRATRPTTKNATEKAKRSPARLNSTSVRANGP